VYLHPQEQSLIDGKTSVIFGKFVTKYSKLYLYGGVVKVVL